MDLDFPAKGINQGFILQIIRERTKIFRWSTFKNLSTVLILLSLELTRFVISVEGVRSTQEVYVLLT